MQKDPSINDAACCSNSRLVAGAVLLAIIIVCAMVLPVHAEDALALSSTSDSNSQSRSSNAEQADKPSTGNDHLDDPAGDDARHAAKIDPRLIASWQQPFYQVECGRDSLEHFGLELINLFRQDSKVLPLRWDATANHVAKSLIEDLVPRDVVSHLASTGENPDVRYTRAGGTGCIHECLAVIEGSAAARLNRAAVCRLIEEMKADDVDKEALLNPDATHLAFCLQQNGSKDRIIACVEVVTNEAAINSAQSIGTKLTIGDSVDISGDINAPFEFDKLTVGWDGALPEPQMKSLSIERDEALPFIEPVDYVGYVEKIPHDRRMLCGALKVATRVGLQAGNFFAPGIGRLSPAVRYALPTAHALPAGTQDLPLQGGVHVRGLRFSARIPLDYQQRPGIYYVTLWAHRGGNDRPVPISRRAFVVKDAAETAPSG